MNYGKMLAIICIVVALALRETEGLQEVCTTFAFDMIGYKLDLARAIQTTAVHSDDGGNGEAIAKVNGGITTAFRSAVSYSLGGETVRLKIGTAAILNFSPAGYRRGMYAVQKQAIAYDSYAFTQFGPQLFGFKPFVGIEGRFDNFITSMNVALPNMGFQVKSGHDRYGMWQVVQQENWRGFGRSISGEFDYKISKSWSVGFNLDYEKYDAKFKGEKNKIEAIAGGITGKYRFTVR